MTPDYLELEELAEEWADRLWAARQIADEDEREGELERIWRQAKEARRGLGAR